MPAIASFVSDPSGPLLVLAWGTLIPVVWVAVLDTGPRGKNARKVLSILFRRRPPK